MLSGFITGEGNHSWHRKAPLASDPCRLFNNKPALLRGQIPQIKQLILYRRPIGHILTNDKMSTGLFFLNPCILFNKSYLHALSLWMELLMCIGLDNIKDMSFAKAPLILVIFCHNKCVWCRLSIAKLHQSALLSRLTTCSMCILIFCTRSSPIIRRMGNKSSKAYRMWYGCSLFSHVQRKSHSFAPRRRGAQVKCTLVRGHMVNSTW